MVIHQYDVCLVNLDPTVGHEIKKTRPCLVISPDEVNKHLQTVMIAPMTTKSHAYPSRVSMTFGGKKGFVILDQIRTVDRVRLVKTLGKASRPTITAIKETIREMLVD